MRFMNTLSDHALRRHLNPRFNVFSLIAHNSADANCINLTYSICRQYFGRKKTRHGKVARVLSATDLSSRGRVMSGQRCITFQWRMKCQRCSWPRALDSSSRFHQTPCPQAQVLLLGQREEALTFEIGHFFFFFFINIYICFQDEGKIGHLLLLIFPVCSESVAKFWEFHKSWLPLKTTLQMCFFFFPRRLGVLLSVFTFEKSQYVL